LPGEKEESKVERWTRGDQMLAFRVRDITFVEIELTSRHQEHPAWSDDEIALEDFDSDCSFYDNKGLRLREEKEG